jgi:hypothetical protein
MKAAGAALDPFPPKGIDLDASPYRPRKTWRVARKARTSALGGKR